MIFRNVKSIFSYSIYVVLLVSFTVSAVMDLDARKRRSYNPQKTRNAAMETIENSNELSKIANYGGGEFPEDSLSLEYQEGEDINELELEDNIVFSMDQLMDFYLAFVEGYDNDMVTKAGISKKALMDNITDWLGTPYRFGGTSRRAIDCSAFVLTIFKNSGGIRLPRTARAQYSFLKTKITRDELEFGDIIFFHTRRYTYVSHVGIYLGDNLFAHASSKYGVTISSLESNYYSKRFIGGRRITEDQMKDLSINK